MSRIAVCLAATLTAGLAFAWTMNASATATAAAASSIVVQQQADEMAVRAVMKKLFDGMKARDTTMMRSVFHPEARMYGTGRDGSVQVTMPGQFIAGIAAAPANLVLDEVLHDVEVRVDGNLATVWAYYDLFLSAERFSHCGYDAAQLLKSNGAWTIVALADSRRTTNCRQKRS